VYSLRLSLYRFEASTLAGEDVLGSFKRLQAQSQRTAHQIESSHLPLARHFPTLLFHVPLNARQNRRNIISRTPPILQDIQTQLARAIDIRMEHHRYKLDARGLIWVCFIKVHDKAEGAIFERRVGGTDYDCVPNSGVLAYV
jgi:hypothetical protein